MTARPRWTTLLSLALLMASTLCTAVAADRGPDTESNGEPGPSEVQLLPDEVGIEPSPGMPTSDSFFKMLEEGGLTRTEYSPAGTPACPAVWVCGLAACGESHPQHGCLLRGTRCSPGSSCNDVDTGLTECQVGNNGFACIGGKTIHTRTCACKGCAPGTCLDGCASATQRTFICK